MKNLLRFLSLYAPFKWKVAGGVALALATSLAGIALLAVSGWFIAAMGLAGMTSVGMNYFTPAASIRGLSILRTGGRYFERLVNHDAALRVTSEFRVWFYRRLEPLAPAGIRDLHSAEIFSRLRADIDALERFYLNGIVPVATAVLAAGLLGAWLLFYHWPLGLLLVSLLLFCGFAVPFAVRRRSLAEEKEISEIKTSLNRGLTDSLQGMKELLVYGRMRESLRRIEGDSGRLLSVQRNIHMRECMIQACIMLCMGVAMAGTLLFVIPLVNEGTVKPADLAMTALIAFACFDIVTPLPAALQSFQSAMIAAERVFELAGRKNEATGKRGNARVEEHETFSLNVEGAGFSYGENPVLRDVSFSLNAGEVLVLEGESGKGKSTVVNLLCGFWAPDAGRVLINGRGIMDYDEEALRAHFGVSPQRPYLFADTMRANLSLARPDAGESEILDACVKAGLRDMIENLPDGLDTYAGENGWRLSGGQIRRLSLARAMLRDAPCLILDEPAEGLDPEMEDRVMRSLLNRARAKDQAVILCLHDAQKEWLPKDVKKIRL